MRLSVSRRLIAPSLSILLIGVAGVASYPATAHAASSVRIRPGSIVNIAGVRCTAGAILHQGSHVYVAIPASCGGIEPGSLQYGCTEPQAPAGLPVHVAGEKHRATLVYSSFTQMQGTGVKSLRECRYNDLALIELNHADNKLATGGIAGAGTPKAVMREAPAPGSHLKLGTTSVTAGAPGHGNWTYALTTSEKLTTTNLGTPLLKGGQLLGMLTILPAGVLTKTPPTVYNLHKALVQLHKVGKFRHVHLLPAGATG